MSIYIPDIPAVSGGLCEREIGITAGVVTACLFIGGIPVLLLLMIVIIVLWKKQHSHDCKEFICYIHYTQSKIFLFSLGEDSSCIN